MNFSIHDPFTGEAYSRDPRNIARKAEAYLEVDRHRRHRVLRRRGRVLRLRRRALRDQAERRLLLHRLHRGAPGTPAARRRAATAATRPATRAATSPSRRSTTSPTCATRCASTSTTVGLERRAQPPRGRHRRPGGDQLPVQHAAAVRRRHDEVQVHRQEHRLGSTARPRPSCRSRSSATTARACTCHQSLWKDGEPLFYDEPGYGGLSDIARWYIGGLLKHAPSLLAFTNPTVNSYHRLVPGFEAPVNLVYSAAQPLGLRPHPDHRATTRRPSASSSASPTRRPTRTSASPRC